jgi:hypothetical protein
MRLLILCCCWLVACSAPEPDAGQIVADAIRVQGGERLQNCRVEFDFRDKHYVVERNGGIFRYRRMFSDSTGTIVDVLDNRGFVRRINGRIHKLTPEDSAAFANALNSVVYFALLPMPLGDPAVQLRKLPDGTIKGEPYYKIEVTFSPDGGGQDYEDVFVYWFHKRHKTLDYLAYRFHVNGGGMRFREAIHPRVVSGVRFADYRNYKPMRSDADLYALDSAFEANHLQQVSEIILENIRVEELKPTGSLK